MSVVWQGPGGVANLHVETAIDEASGKLTMLYQVRALAQPAGVVGTWFTVRSWRMSEQAARLPSTSHADH